MNWTDISLNKFNQLKQIILDDELSHEDKLLYEIQILFDVSNPSNLKIHELSHYINELKFLEEKIPTMRLKDTYVLGGTEYELRKKIQNFTVAQWIDWSHFVQDGADTENFPKLLSVFFFPKGVKDYNEGYDIEKVRSDIDNYLSIADANRIATFFLTLQKALLVNSLLYTRRLIMKSPLNKMRKKMINLEIRTGLKKIIYGD